MAEVQYTRKDGRIIAAKRGHFKVRIDQVFICPASLPDRHGIAIDTKGCVVEISDKGMTNKHFCVYYPGPGKHSGTRRWYKFGTEGLVDEQWQEKPQLVLTA